MLNIRTLTCNPLQERAYVVWKDKGTCVVVDPGCYGDDELQAFEGLLAQEKLTPAAILLTHGHFDHIFGVKALQDRFGGIPVYMHPADEVVLDYGADMAARLGLAPAATDFRRTPRLHGHHVHAMVAGLVEVDRARRAAVPRDLLLALDPLRTVDVPERHIVVRGAKFRHSDALLAANHEHLVVSAEVKLALHRQMRHQNRGKSLRTLGHISRQSREIFLLAVFFVFVK